MTIPKLKLTGTPLPGSDPGGKPPIIEVWMQDGKVCISITDEDAMEQAAIALDTNAFNRLRTLGEL